MIIKAFFNAHALNELLAGGSGAASSRVNPTNNQYIEVLMDTHEYDVSPAVDPTVGMAYFTFTKKVPKYAAPQQVQQAPAPATKVVSEAKATS